MTEKLKQTIKEEMVELPKEIQEAINAFDWVKIAEEIGKKYLLDEDEINNLQLETLLVLISATDPEFYAVNIENQVETTKETAEGIADEVFKKIFNPINNSVAEKIKENLKNTKADWQQNIDFVLLDGNYSVFMEKNNNLDITPDTLKTTTLDNSSRITNIKSKFII